MGAWGAVLVWSSLNPLRSAFCMRCHPPSPQPASQSAPPLVPSPLWKAMGTATTARQLPPSAPALPPQAPRRGTTVPRPVRWSRRWLSNRRTTCDRCQPAHKPQVVPPLPVACRPCAPVPKTAAGGHHATAILANPARNPAPRPRPLMCRCWAAEDRGRVAARLSGWRRSRRATSL